MIHVITPFSRPENARILVDHLARQGVAVTWHPVVSSVPFPADCLREWVTPMQVDVPRKMDAFAWKLKAFIESGRIVDGERYGVLCDDDMYDDGLLAAVGRMTSPVVVVSMLRGDRVPERADGGFCHPTDELVAGPENMRVCGAGLQQCFMAGEVLREMEIDPWRAPFCDGLAVAQLGRQFKDVIRYAPGLHVLFNRLEPGRWAVDDEEVERWR